MKRKLLKSQNGKMGKQSRLSGKLEEYHKRK
jgi:hypothetical protein